MQKQTSRKALQWTILEVLKWTADYFSSHGIDNPRLTAEILLAETLEIDRVGLYVRFDQPLTESERTRFRAMVKRRVSREPVAYIVGRKDFWNIALEVTPDVLIPRPETEILVAAALEMMPDNRKTPFRVLDMGTGSGAIVISLAHSMPSPFYAASDISFAALQVAARNAFANNVADRIFFFVSRWFESISKTFAFDMILSNPPYIPSTDIRRLAPEIANHEPALALDGDADGLRDISILVSESHGFLVDGGILMMEIGHDQKDAVERLVEKRPEWADLCFKKDYAGHHRVAVLKR